MNHIAQFSPLERTLEMFKNVWDLKVKKPYIPPASVVGLTSWCSRRAVHLTIDSFPICVLDSVPPILLTDFPLLIIFYLLYSSASSTLSIISHLHLNIFKSILLYKTSYRLLSIIKPTLTQFSSCYSHNTLILILCNILHCHLLNIRLLEPLHNMV